MTQALLPRLPSDADDTVLVERALQRDGAAFRTIMERYNRRLYRLVRGILRDDSEAEDAVQEAYMRAFSHLESFRGESSLATWLGRIAINEALGRLRRQRPTVSLEAAEAVEAAGSAAAIIPFPRQTAGEDPERSMAQRQILAIVEEATDNLPDVYRSVFMARVIEGLSVEETAAVLGLRQETVKTRLHRARRLVREQVDKQIGPVLLEAFPFAGRRCQRMTAAVMARLGLSG